MRSGYDRRKSRRRAVVTGGAGFIGSHLCERLLVEDHEVTAVDDLSAGSRDNLAGPLGDDRFRLVTADAGDAELMDRLVSEADVVFHLAATVGVRRAVEEPRHVIENNVKSTNAVLHACSRYLTRVIIASSSEVYGRNSAVPLDEEQDRVLGPPQVQRWSYSASKGIDEMLAFAFHREFDVPATVTRFFNTTGPRQSGEYGMVVPRFVEAAMAGETISIFGDGTQSRCFCHVADTVDALVRLADAEDTVGQVFNVGSTEEITIAELADLAVRLVREMRPDAPTAEPPTRLVPYDEAYNAGYEDTPRRVPSIDRIHAATGWRPRTNVADIMRELIKIGQVPLLDRQ